MPTYSQQCSLVYVQTGMRLLAGGGADSRQQELYCPGIASRYEGPRRTVDI